MQYCLFRGDGNHEDEMVEASGNVKETISGSHHRSEGSG